MEQALIDAGRRFEEALIAIRRATDSRGLKIFLYNGPYTSEGLKTTLRMFARRFADGNLQFVNFDGEPDPYSELGKITFARHLVLLSSAYLAALEYEHVNGGPLPVPSIEDDMALALNSMRGKNP